MPHDKEHVLADVHKAGAAEVERAIAASAEAWEDWHRLPWEERAAVFLRAAELLAGPWRSTLVAATMLNQSKTAHQAEIDAACEVIDFWRFNVEFMTRIYEEQPVSSPGVWNRMEYRPLEGFVFAITPFNFTAIGANLVDEPGADGRRRALEAGLDGGALVVLDDEAARGGGPAAGRRSTSCPAAAPRSAIPCSPASTSPASTSPARPRSSTRSGRRSARTSTATATTRASSARPAARTSSSRTRARTSTPSRPRSCAARSSTRARSARPPRACTRPRTSGRSCASGSSRRSATIKMGDVSDFSNFMGAVIDGKSFARQREAIEHAKGNEAEVIAGGGTDDSKGYFVEPTVIETKDPRDRLMSEEFFGPIVTTYVYPEDEWEQTLELVDETAPYGLTGAIFSQDRGGDRRGAGGAALRGRQLLRQRQADRRGRRPAAVRRLARVGHERQGRLDVEPDPLGQPAHDQGDVRPAAGLPLPVPGRRRLERHRAARAEASAPRRRRARARRRLGGDRGARPRHRRARPPADGERCARPRLLRPRLRPRHRRRRSTASRATARW